MFLPKLFHKMTIINLIYLSSNLSLTQYWDCPNERNLCGGAAIAQWIRLRLPSCRPGFESQAHHLCFHQFIKKIVYCGKDENKQKRGRDRSIFKKSKFK